MQPLNPREERRRHLAMEAELNRASEELRHQTAPRNVSPCPNPPSGLKFNAQTF